MTTVALASIEDTMALGVRIALACENALVIYLSGELGAGKTTVARAFIGALGYVGRVKSPSYALVESYVTQARPVLHFDLYRLADPEELEFIGIRDYLEMEAVWLVEWPEHGAGMLPPADLEVVLRHLPAGREAALRWKSDRALRHRRRFLGATTPPGTPR